MTRLTVIGNGPGRGYFVVREQRVGLWAGKLTTVAGPYTTSAQAWEKVRELRAAEVQA